MAFDLLDVSLKLVPVLRPVVATVRLQDRELADQIRRAVNDIALQVAEAARRAGRGRTQHFTYASGSAHELKAALGLVEGWGYVEPEQLAQARDLLDRVLAMLWRLT